MPRISLSQLTLIEHTCFMASSFTNAEGGFLKWRDRPSSSSDASDDSELDNFSEDWTCDDDISLSHHELEVDDESPSCDDEPLNASSDPELAAQPAASVNVSLPGSPRISKDGQEVWSTEPFRRGRA